MTRQSEIDRVAFWFALVAIFGSKLVLIKTFSGSSPYWDQWDAEAAYLYKPYLEGQLQLQQLLSAHNEHRIFATRMIALALLELRGAWDPQLQMIGNAALHTAVAGVFLNLLWWSMDQLGRMFLLVFSAFILLLPLGFDNTLCGFQSQFHLVSLFSLLAIGLGYRSGAFAGSWWWAMALALLSFLSSANGSLTFLLLATLFFLQIAAGVRAGWREWFAVICMLGTFGITLMLVPHVAEHEPLKAHSIVQFAKAAAKVFSWPVLSGSPLLLLVNLPVVLFAWTIWRERPDRADRRWLVLGLAGWSALQSLSFAYGRTAAPVESRYLDIMVLNLAINVAAGLQLLSVGKNGDRSVAKSIGAVWIALIGITLGIQAEKALIGIQAEKALKSAVERSRAAQAHSRNVTRYLISGDPAALAIPAGEPAYAVIPYPSSERLRLLLDDATIRSILLAPLNPTFDGSAAASRLVSRGIFSGAVVLIKQALLSMGWPMFVGGFLLMLVTSVGYAQELVYRQHR